MVIKREENEIIKKEVCKKPNCICKLDDRQKKHIEFIKFITLQIEEHPDKFFIPNTDELDILKLKNKNKDNLSLLLNYFELIQNYEAVLKNSDILIENKSIKFNFDEVKNNISTLEQLLKD